MSATRPGWLPGNTLTLLENGEEFYPRVFDAIRGAEREVLLETFIWYVDPVGLRLREALCVAARRGVEVHVLFDGWGSPDLDEEFMRPLLEAGVKLRAFEPVQRFLGARVNLLRRMHRKLVVVDARRAFVGGINYSLDHLRVYGPEAKQDYAVEVQGPLVDEIHAFCRASLVAPQPRRERWQRAYRRLRDFRGARFTRRRAALGAGDASRGGDAAAGPDSGAGALAAFVTRDNRHHRDDIERQYRLALRAARERVVIANAYFFPGWRLLKDMRRAVRRGVRVDLVLQGEPDMAIVQTAASLLYAHLLRAGVQVHEYCERPLHGKVAVVDDAWATIGSSNLDPISLGLNLEANVFVRDQAFARHLRERLDELIMHRCRRVALPRPGPLASAWITLRSAVIFHFLRRFPAWASRLPVQAPKVAALHAADAG
jgi:cardiolipin synthase A/B